WFGKIKRHGDARYYTDDLGNFTERHNWLVIGDSHLEDFVNNAPVEAMAEKDREMHRYMFRMDGTTKEMTARFHVTTKRSICDHPEGPLTLTIQELPEGTPSPAAGERMREAEREQARQAQEAIRE